MPAWIPRLRRLSLAEEIDRRRTRLQSAPQTVNLEFTDRCNVRPACTFCTGKNEAGYREHGHLEDEVRDRIWPDLLRARRVNDCSYGEPMLYPRFEETIAALAAAGVAFGFTSNGLLLDERRARFLLRHAEHVDMAVSVNAATAETYHKLHGRDFHTLVRNLSRFVDLHHELAPHTRLPLVPSFIVMRCNRHETLPFLRWVSAMGAQRVMLRHLFDLEADGYAVDNFGHAFDYEEQRLALEDYRALQRQAQQDPALAGLEIHYQWDAEHSFIAEQSEQGSDIPCLFPWKFLCVRPQHDIYTPCVFLKRGIGHPSQHSIAEVWNGAVMRGMRRALSRGQLPDFCRTHGHACPLVLGER